MSNSNFERRYKTVKVLGEGAMGVVYLCEQKSLSRQVAVKLLKDDLRDKELKLRFKREAKILASIRHENVARVFDFDTTEEPPYIVQEYLSGLTLHEFIREKGSLTAKQCVDFAKQIAAGLIQVHALGVVHRDLKPANIFIENSRRAKILDFGLAQGKPSMTRLTKTGLVLGTPQYMAPEQMFESIATEQADLYALGAIMYEMLAGHAPIEAESLQKLLDKKLESEIQPLHQVCEEELPPPLIDLIDDLLKKEASERPNDAVTVMSRLHELSFIGGIPQAYEKELMPAEKPVKENTNQKCRLTSNRAAKERSKLSKFAIASFIALFIVGLAIFHSIFASNSAYEAKSLQVQIGQDSLLVTWKSPQSYTSKVEVKKDDGKVLTFAGKAGATQDHQVLIPDLQDNSEYCLRIAFPNGECSLWKSYKTFSGPPEVYLGKQGHLHILSSGTKHVEVKAGSKPIETKRLGKNEWSANLAAKVKDLHALTATIELLNSGTRKEHNLAPLLLTRLKKKARSLFQFNKDDFLEFINKTDYKSASTMDEPLVDAKQESLIKKAARKRKSMRGKAVHEFAQIHHVTDAFQELVNTSPLVFNSSLFDFADKRHVHSAYVNGLLISLFAHNRQVKPRFDYEVLPKLGEFALTIKRRKNASFQALLYKRGLNENLFGPTKLSFHKVTSRLKTSFELAAVNNLQWAEVCLQSEQVFRFVIWLNVNNSLALPMFVEPYMSIPNAFRRKFTIVQRIPVEALRQGNNKIEIVASHALDGSRRQRIALTTVHFYSRQKLE